ncbi:MAG: IPT/TIG domain-containing protein [Sandaracinaceae bacterium]|nr:IPT/TIG domain-containing protein [Sandaracinaceae bacterium]
MALPTRGLPALIAFTIPTAILIALSMAPAGAGAQVQRPLPVVQRLEPTSGPPGTEVQVVGRHFDETQTLWLGESELEVTARLPNRWTVRVPQGAPSAELEIRTSRGNVTGPRFRVTEAAPAPVIASFAPASGAPGAEVTINGQNFSPRLAENLVHLGERPVVVRHATPTTLSVIVPADAATSAFRVEVTGAGSATSSAPFTVTTGTTIAGFEPALAPPGTRLIVRGTGFSRRASDVRLYFGDLRLQVRRASETELQADVPRNAPIARARLLVEVRRSARAYSSTELEVRPAPVISGIEPAFGAPGTRVTISGQYFGADVRQIALRLGEASLTVRDLAEGRVVAEIPQGAASGNIELTASGLGPARAATAFEVVEAVRIDSFGPQSGGAGSTVTLHGAGFSAVRERNHATLSGQPCEIVAATTSELQVRLPDTASGPIVVAVDNAGEARTRQPFVITRAPTVAAFDPPHGAVGATVTIRGRNFGSRPGLVDVRFGDARAVVQSVNDTEMVVQVPPGATSGPVRILVRLQGSVASPMPFEVTAE